MRPFASVEYSIDRALFIRFLKFQRRTGVRRFLNYTVYIISGIGLLLVGANLLLNGFEQDTVIMIILILSALGLTVFSSYYLPLLKFKSLGKILTAPQRIELYPEHFTVEMSGEEYSGQNSVCYEGLVKAYQTEDMFYLYISKHQAFLLPVDSLDGGAIAQLSSILEQKLGVNFKV